MEKAHKSDLQFIVRKVEVPYQHKETKRRLDRFCTKLHGVKAEMILYTNNLSRMFLDKCSATESWNFPPNAGILWAGQASGEPIQGGHLLGAVDQLILRIRNHGNSRLFPTVKDGRGQMTMQPASFI